MFASTGCCGVLLFGWFVLSFNSVVLMLFGFYLLFCVNWRCSSVCVAICLFLLRVLRLVVWLLLTVWLDLMFVLWTFVCLFVLGGVFVGLVVTVCLFALLCLRFVYCVDWVACLDFDVWLTCVGFVLVLVGCFDLAMVNYLCFMLLFVLNCSVSVVLIVFVVDLLLGLLGLICLVVVHGLLYLHDWLGWVWYTFVLVGLFVVCLILWVCGKFGLLLFVIWFCWLLCFAWLCLLAYTFTCFVCYCILRFFLLVWWFCSVLR